MTTQAAPVALASDFTLPSHRGGEFRLSSAFGSGPVLLVFIRGHWCPYCRRYLQKIEQHMERLRTLCAQIVAISPEAPEVSLRLAEDLKLSFPILSDGNGKVIDAYGVRNTFSSVRTLMPHPAVFILDPDGAILFKSIDRNYKKRTTIRSLIQVLQSWHTERPASA